MTCWGGIGLLECSRQLGLSLNTVKRYAGAAEPRRMIRAPKYRATLVDPYRDHLRARRAADPAVPIQRLLTVVRQEHGFWREFCDRCLWVIAAVAAA